jgi:hypothetical protein
MKLCLGGKGYYNLPILKGGRSSSNLVRIRATRRFMVSSDADFLHFNHSCFPGGAAHFTGNTQI